VDDLNANELLVVGLPQMGDAVLLMYKKTSSCRNTEEYAHNTVHRWFESH
jgi:hypothetical protein